MSLTGEVSVLQTTSVTIQYPLQAPTAIAASEPLHYRFKLYVLNCSTRLYTSDSSVVLLLLRVLSTTAIGGATDFAAAVL
jgi:hypothetical protein